MHNTLLNTMPQTWQELDRNKFLTRRKEYYVKCR